MDTHEHTNACGVCSTMPSIHVWLLHMSKNMVGVSPPPEDLGRDGAQAIRGGRRHALVQHCQQRAPLLAGELHRLVLALHISTLDIQVIGVPAYQLAGHAQGRAPTSGDTCLTGPRSSLCRPTSRLAMHRASAPTIGDMCLTWPQNIVVEACQAADYAASPRSNIQRHVPQMA